MAAKLADRYDTIVVGAGSAGCAVANRLSADQARKVLLIEAGPSRENLFIKMPSAFTYAAGSRHFDWGYRSAADASLAGRSIECPRGRLVGGSSAVNAMSFVRGNAADFDRWASNKGLQSWSYQHCLPYFKKMENYSAGANQFRGGDGPLNVTAPTFSNPLCDVFVDACKQRGYDWVGDTNAASQAGFGVMDQTIHNGVRVSCANAYLDPVRDRANLQIFSDAQVSRVIFSGTRASGVELFHQNERFEVNATEVILSAGAINSPQLLMLSGIGPGQHLSEHGITPLLELPGVGKNLQDHVDISIKYECLLPVSTTPYLQWQRKAMLGLQWLLTRKGLGATNHFEVAGYVGSSPQVIQPDLQLVFIPLLVKRSGDAFNGNHGFQVAASLLRPNSRGSITLQGSDWREPPRMQFNYLQNSDDVAGLRNAVRLIREIVNSAAFERYRGAEVEPGMLVDSDEALDSFLRQSANSTHHPACSCKMGYDSDAVVDAEGRVHGCENLRVIDASIMPSITSGNINAPTIMIAEKIVDAM